MYGVSMWFPRPEDWFPTDQADDCSRDPSLHPLFYHNRPRFFAVTVSRDEEQPGSWKGESEGLPAGKCFGESSRPACVSVYK